MNKTIKIFSDSSHWLNQAHHNKDGRQQPQPCCFQVGGVPFRVGILAPSGIVAGLGAFVVSLKMDRHALVFQHLTGQDHMFALPDDVPDPAGALVAPHRDEGERLLADAQVLLEGLAACAGAHGPDPVQVFWVQEGLGGSLAAAVLLDVVPPLVLIQRGGQPRADVAPDESIVAVVPFGSLAGSVVVRARPMSRQDAGGHQQRQARGGHSPSSPCGGANSFTSTPEQTVDFFLQSSASCYKNGTVIRRAATVALHESPTAVCVSAQHKSKKKKPKTSETANIFIPSLSKRGRSFWLAANYLESSRCGTFLSSGLRLRLRISRLGV